jgi:2,3-bisphosphoglycerate-independent phosphoglycerate mutase
LQPSRYSHIELLSSLARKTESKILLVVLDGVGGLPVKGRTELESARTPNLDEAARRGSCGLTIPVLPGVTPGSGPSHLAIFGYDPLVYEIARGALEVYGVGRTLEENQIGARGNFCSMNSEGIVVDRRAGRLATEENARLCGVLNGETDEIDGVRFEFVPGKEHRFVLLMTGDRLSSELSDTDPHQDMEHYAECTGRSAGSERTARVVNSLMKKVHETLKSEKAATGVILRGFSARPEIPTMSELYLLSAAAIATYPMYRGVASLLGMAVVECAGTLEAQIEALKKVFDDCDFVYFHFKLTDMAGEDGDFERKVHIIEEFDSQFGRISGMGHDVLAVTSDHSTPASMKKHSWHPNPFVIVSSNVRLDRAERFTERDCLNGCLGTFEAKYAMGLLLAHAGKLDKFGA